MKRAALAFLYLSTCCCLRLRPATMTADISGVRPGPISVDSSNGALNVHWKDSRGRDWTAAFSLDTSKPLITAISLGGKLIVDRARPVYRCSTGKRRGGWDAFFDFPPSHPQGTRSFLGEFHPSAVHARTIGDRLEVSFDGMRLGFFEGSMHYVFYPGSQLIEQQAAMVTHEPDVAYFYDAGIQMMADADRRAGGNMESTIGYFDPLGQFQTITPRYGSEWHPLQVRYRTLAWRSENGSVAAFPAPHQYFFARDYTTNMGYVWQSSWRGHVSLGIRQLPDDNSPFYPWMNAPPGTEQQMRVFLLLDDGDPRSLLDEVTRYTHHDRFPRLDGYKTFAPHWHLAYTVRAMEKGLDWQPPFKPVMKSMGLDSAMIMDFHGDGHPEDLTGIRLHELEQFYKACRAQSGPDFLLIPSEEANVHLGGHWALVFPKPVYWYMDRKPSEPVRTADPKYGTVYRVHDAKELWEMVRAENGYVYQTHPRTKGSTGYPDKIRETDYFRDARYLGTGWKAMPSDLSSPRLGERAFKILDDMNNWGLKKRSIGEVDVFQLDATHELYAHMNVNYVRVPALAGFEDYSQVLTALARGDYFTTTGEILVPTVDIKGIPTDKIAARARVSYTFPLRMAEIVWGNGTDTQRKIIPLDETHEFGDASFTWEADSKSWKWARVAVWDVAGDGAFTNPVWRE